MARGKKNKGLKEDVEAYWHDTDKRKNAVPVVRASYDTSKPKPKKYEYDPRLDISSSNPAKKTASPSKSLTIEGMR